MRTSPLTEDDPGIAKLYVTARKSLVGVVVVVVPDNKSRRGREILISIFWSVPRIPKALEFGGGISVSVELVDDELELLLELLPPLLPPLLLLELPLDEPPPDELPPLLLRELLPLPVLPPPPLVDRLPPLDPPPEPPPELPDELEPPEFDPPELEPPELELLELEDVVVDDADSSTGGGIVNVIERTSSSIR